MVGTLKKFKLVDGKRLGEKGSKQVAYKTKTLNISRGGGGYSIYPWVGRCSLAPHTLTLFKTNTTDFPTLFKTEL